MTNMIHAVIRKLFDESDTREPTWATEEAQISTPYGETAAWEQMLENQYFAGWRHFNRPPGMWEKLVAKIEA